MSQWYCYNDKCSARTKREPWPRSDVKPSKAKKPRAKCLHCNGKMTRTYSMFDEEYQ